MVKNMRKKLLKLFGYVLYVIVIMAIIKTKTYISTKDIETINKKTIDFEVTSKTCIVINEKSGEILYEKNAYQVMLPASITKILTCITALEVYNLDDYLLITHEMINVEGSKMYLEEGKMVSISTLLYGLMMVSGNDAGTSLVKGYGNGTTDFIDKMNEVGKKAGMKYSKFYNATGLDDSTNNYTCAYDMALIAQYCMQNEAFRNIVSMPSCTIDPTDKYEKRYFKNTNDLLDSKSKYYYENAIGIKTGFTTQAKNCLISASQKDNMELITVVLGAEATADGRSGRYVDTINLFDYGFANYKIQKINSANAEVQSLTIKNATKETKNLPVVLKDNISALVPSNIDLSDLKYEVNLNTEVSAPITEGDVLGKITYNIDGINYSSDLVAEHCVEKFNYYLFGLKIALVIIVSLILIKLIFFRKKKKRNKKNKNNYYKNYDAIYRIR
mgnify:CR=1 FL=1